jgi:hypothetical protein
MLYKIKVWYRIIRTPSCWSRLYGTSEVLSARINLYLDSGESPENITSYECTLGNLTLWIENWPYAYGYLSTLNEPGGVKLLPDRETVFRLRDSVKYAVEQKTTYTGNNNKIAKGAV